MDASHPGIRNPPEDTASLLLPVPSQVFAKRSARLQFLSRNHAVGPYLEAMAWLAQAQHVAAQAPLSGTEPPPPPDYPFDLRDHCYGARWQKMLRVILSEMQVAPLPQPSQAALSRLEEASPAVLEYSARAIIDGSLDGIDLAASPFLAAALQVYWTGMASRAQIGNTERVGPACPLCASRPVAGVISSGRKLRYLQCSLCATHWYVPRLTCTNCSSTEAISYFSVDGDANATKAEACGECNTYLKLFYPETNPEADAVADDLSTIALDFLMADRGYSRSGVNLFLLARK